MLLSPFYHSRAPPPVKSTAGDGRKNRYLIVGGKRSVQCRQFLVDRKFQKRFIFQSRPPFSSPRPQAGQQRGDRHRRPLQINCRLIAQLFTQSRKNSTRKFMAFAE